MPKLQDYELEQLYKEFIDETTPVVEIWGMEYEASRVLLEVDPIAFRVGFHDWIDSQDPCEECDRNLLECTCPDEVIN